ncbi:hypothetical protein AZE42_13268 [Rhizopogon vesiculosus]|uniref:Uncharacterized protein n=1 Tax=Rhizopogon vesiculosus TaxID=180088 RepID=A0A1J8QVC4_9AGAM|nr:hypothetical protein AZE42_13268 [Rhizopogon vesiculosus]
MDHSDLEGIIQELVKLTDPDSMEDSSSCLLELDELHLLNFTHYAETALVHRLYKQLTTVKTLTLGELEWTRNFALTMGLLPAPYGLTGLPLPRLQKLILLDVPRDVVRRVVLERTSVSCRLEELCHRTLNEGEEVDRSVPNDWQHHVEKYDCIGPPQSSRYSDIVGRQCLQ